MNKLLLSGAFLAALGASPATPAMLTVAVFDNGVLEGLTTSTDGTASLSITTDPAFDVIDVSAAGSPFIPHADLSSVSLSVTSAAISTAHVITADIFQSGVSLPAFLTRSAFTTNNLIGTPGGATLSTFVNGTGITDLGTTLASHFFPLGTIADTAEVDKLAPALTSDASEYRMAFFAPDQSNNSTIQLTTGVPEASTWAMMVFGFIGMFWIGKKTIKPMDWTSQTPV
jgi:hypothetical protein